MELRMVEKTRERLLTLAWAKDDVDRRAVARLGFDLKWELHELLRPLRIDRATRKEAFAIANEVSAAEKELYDACALPAFKGCQKVAQRMVESVSRAVLLISASAPKRSSAKSTKRR